MGQLVQALDGNQPNVSKHLQILTQAGIVTRRRSGINIIYSIKDPTVFTLCELVRGRQARHRMRRSAANPCATEGVQNS